MAALGLATREASKPKAEPARTPALKPPAPSASHGLPGFWSGAGNLAIQRLAADPSHSRSGPILLQRKLTIGSVDDPLEHEADHVAEHVMRMPARVGPIDSGAPQVQRKCGCGTCDSCRTDEEPWTVQRKSAAHPAIGAAGASTSTSMDAPPIVHDVLRSPGQPLDPGTRSFMEPRFGRDFSTVRLHTDAKAAESAAAVQARAYTVGHSIVLGRNESTSDLPVLAHELTHVVQQTGIAPALQRLTFCRSFLENTTPYVAEYRVRDELAGDAAPFGRVETELSIPEGTAAGKRTEREPTVIFPYTGADAGRADVALLIGTTLEILEVKKATWEDDGAEFAEGQLERYLRKAAENTDYVTENWRGRRRANRADQITSVRPMPMSRLDLEPNPRVIDGDPVALRWCNDGIVVFKLQPEPEEEPEEPEEKGPKDKGPEPSAPLPERLVELGAKLAKLLAADGVLSAALSFVGRFALMLTPFMALAALAFGIVYFWDQIKWVAGMIAGAAKRVWDTVSSVVGKIKDAIKELGIKIAELAVFVGGLIKDVVEAIAEGLLRAGRAIISGAKWLGGKIAEGAEAVWDWLFGDDIEPIIPDIELPLTPEPTRCVSVAREDALIQMNSDLLFPFGKHRLEDMGTDKDKDKNRATAEAVLEEAAAKLRATPRTPGEPIRFLGYTDVIGEEVDNQVLSEQRAAAVADWFVKKGHVGPKDKVKIDGFGETQAKAPANDTEGRKQDRRVDILVKTPGAVVRQCW